MEEINFFGKRYTGLEGAKILLENQLKGIEMAVERHMIVKINTVYIPGINEEHIPEIAKKVGEMGVYTFNVIPLIAQYKFADITPPTPEMKRKMQDELMLDEIKGYRITEKYIFIEANTASKKTIKISTYFGKINEILLWLAERYPDLDEVQVEVDKKEIMNNALFGQSEEQREEKLAGARKVADALNWTGSVISMWTLFFPTPYAYAILAASSFPPTALYIQAEVTRHNSGNLRFPYSEIHGSQLVYQLPMAYRRLQRPSSALGAKASTDRT